MLAITLSSILGEVILIAAMAILLFLIFKIGKGILGIIFGVVINSIVGLISIAVMNSVFGLGIPYSVPVVGAVAVFGLPAVGTIIILKMLGAVA